MVRTDPGRVIARIDRLCAEGLPERQLRVRALDEIARVVQYDAYAFLLTDPVTCVGASPLAAIPSLTLDRLPTLIRAKYLTQVNRWTSLSTAASLARETNGELHRSRIWTEVQQELGVTDVLSVVFRDRHGCWAFLDLWRTAPGEYDTDEIAFLANAARLLARGLRQAVATTFTTIASGGRLGPVVLLLREDMTVRWQTPATDEWLRLLNPPDGPASPIPAQAYNVAAQLLASEAGVDDHESSARVHLAGGRWVTLRAARLGPDVVVTIEECAPAERVELFGLAHAMTPRELEVLTLLCSGADTREVALQLVISEHTAHDHVRSVLARGQAHSRTALVARAVGS